MQIFETFLGVYTDQNVVLISAIYIALTLIIMYRRLPFMLFGGLSLLFIAYFSPEIPAFSIVFLFLLTLSIPWVREKIYLSPLLNFLKKKNFFPHISETEEVALKAGNTWIEKDLFSGNPNLKQILQEAYPELSMEETSFMEKQVNHVCSITNDWETYKRKDLSKEVWDYLKKEKFFGMIIPKKYGGLGFSAFGHSTVIHMLASRSQALAITAMVPNSLGPGELLLKYGSEKQKERYLPKLALGKEIPCFALTEPTAGSDASSIKSEGILYRCPESRELKIRLNFEKRYITLGAVATLIGLAFKLKDPENLLGDKHHRGITCALVPRAAKGINIDKRHDPLSVPFMNAPIFGKDVTISLDQVIGEEEGLGKGWEMLMECLAVGRGVSLPALCAGGAKYVARVAGNYASVRTQFGRPIISFEGIQEPLSEIAGYTYLLEAMRSFTAGAINRGFQPSVLNAIVKYHSTEIFRKIINKGMDIQGGAGICLGPKNLLAQAYMATPIAITVEGANIMTRSLLQFGQGAIRCHPYVHEEIEAIQDGDIKKLSKLSWKHLGHILEVKARYFLLALSRGHIKNPIKRNIFSKTERELSIFSSLFSLLANLSLVYYGGKLKFKEKIGGRFGDILSHMFMMVCVLRRFLKDGQQKEHLLLVKWNLQRSRKEIYKAFDNLIENIVKGFLKYPLKLTYSILKPFYRKTCSDRDSFTREVAFSLQDKNIRELLTKGIYLPKEGEGGLENLEAAYTALKKAAPLNKIIHDALKVSENGDLTEEDVIKTLIKDKTLTKKDAHEIAHARDLLKKAIEVDAFPL